MRITVNQLKRIIFEEVSRVNRDISHMSPQPARLGIKLGDSMLDQGHVVLGVPEAGGCCCDDEYDDSYEDYPLGGASYYDADHSMSSAWEPAQKPVNLAKGQKPSLKSLFLQPDENNF